MIFFTVKTGKHMPKKQAEPVKPLSVAEGFKSLDKVFDLYIQEKYDGSNLPSADAVMDMVDAIELEYSLYRDFRAYLERRVGVVDG